MLLDTMCNTFGGVCFIALLVAILSAMLPKPVPEGEDGEPDTARIVENERLAQLQRRRDELRAAEAIQRELLSASFEDGGNITATEAELAAELAEREDAIRDLKAKLLGMEEEIVRLATSTDYNKAEAERLRKLAERLREDIEQLQNAHCRTVRMPLEHELAGIRPVSWWLKGGRLFDIEDSTQCHCRPEGIGLFRKWHYTVIPGAGNRVTKAWVRGPALEAIARRLGGMQYARIFVDSASFGELCLLRDEFVRRGLRYNWHLIESDTLDLVVGTDERVQ
jgi:hypothetical protein